jgi:hypothetical protein
LKAAGAPKRNYGCLPKQYFGETLILLMAEAVYDIGATRERLMLKRRKSPAHGSGT